MTRNLNLAAIKEDLEEPQVKEEPLVGDEAEEGTPARNDRAVQPNTLVKVSTSFQSHRRFPLSPCSLHFY
jgi:hypothetical protein